MTFKEDEPMVQITYTELEGLIRYSERYEILTWELRHIIRTSELGYRDGLEIEILRIKDLLKRYFPKEYENRIWELKRKKEIEDDE